MKRELLRNLPKVDALLRDESLEIYGKNLDYYTFSNGIKKGIEFFRNEILEDRVTSYSQEDVIKKIIEIINKDSKRNLRRVINGSGTIIHTNLGRSIFSKEILKDSFDTLSSYNNLEYNLEKGERGSRYSHLEELISSVTGGEAALVVNNNAAAVLLCLNEFAKNKEVILSRGELVEIGGSFRIPKIMEFAGATLKEVGTTNRTHLEDYKEAIGENTGLLMKVHTSNYKIQGFTHEVSREEIANLANENNLISIEDVGSGVLVDFRKYDQKGEPTIQDILRSGIDIVTFSGDKLLGGPQAGIIVGKTPLINKLKKNQFLRAIRVDKITISILENIFRLYRDEREAIKKIPTLKYILESNEITKKRAIKLSSILSEASIKNNIIETEANIGGGSMPEERIKSFAILLETEISPSILEERLRLGDTPLIGRIEKNRFIIDVKTVEEGDFETIKNGILKALEKGI